MSELICNLPSTDVWVRREYLRDHQDGHGEFVKGVWVSAKSIPGRAFYFETYLPDYGALFDKLPISAFVHDKKTPTPDLPLNNLQFWNCMDYGVAAIHKQFIGSMDYEVLTRDFGKQAEHKSFNLLELDNGQYCLYPNNRMRVYDNSLTPQAPLQPDFKVSTIEYQVENGNMTRLGDTDEYFWKTKDE